MTTALVSAVAMVAMIGTVVLALNAVTRNSIDSALADRLAVITAGVEGNPDGPALALETADDSIDDTTWLYDGNGVKLDGPRASDRVRDAADRLGTVTGRTRAQVGDRVFLAAPVSIRGPEPSIGVLVVSKSLEPYESTRTEILIGLVALGVLVTAGATAVAAWTAGRTLTPVEAMAALADEWSEQALDARFDDLGAHDEIAHLGRTLNVLLDRVAGALRGEQLLTSELAHELRTPLTGVRGEAELALMKAPEGETAAHLDRIVELVDAMSSTISTLLAIARGGDHSGTRTTLREVALAALDGHQKQLPQLHLRLDEAQSQVTLAATTEMAVRALSPLVDNAFRHASSSVSVTADVRTRTVDLHVSDDGPGVAGDPETLFDAGARGASSGGAGLGLALARRVAQTLGGGVRVSSRSAPTTFTLTLPRT